MSNHYGPQIPDGIMSIRLSWPSSNENTPDEEHSALKIHIFDGLSDYEIPKVIQLGEHQYDIAVRENVIKKFRQKCSEMETIPFGANDRLNARHGTLGAAKIAYGKYESILKQGVKPELEEWLKDRMSRYLEIEEGCRQLQRQFGSRV